MKDFTIRRFTILGALFLFASISALAQQQSKLDIALRHVEQNREQWQLTTTDVADMVLSSQHQSQHNGVTHFYFIQRYASVEIYNAIMGVHVLPNGTVTYVANRFIPQISEKANTTSPALSAHDAIQKAAAHLNLDLSQKLDLVEKKNDRFYIYDGGSIAHSDINVKLSYQYSKADNALRLAWNLAIDQITTPDYWSLRVDALTGEILDQNNWTVYCNHHKPHAAHSGCSLDAKPGTPKTIEEALLEESNLMGGTYNVFPVPVESPIHGEREIISDPADATASPYGWHDTNGEDGAEFTITRGNNVHAFLDLDADDTSNGDEPDGGEELIFDYPFDDQTQEPDQYREAAVTQLFYMNNYMHDFAYAYGFDESAGNFQQNNYGNGGSQGDAVNAHAQDGSGTNNANFGTPPDGGSGTMQMFLWDNSGGRILTVTGPEEIAGQTYEARPANFGGNITTDPLEAEVEFVDDGSLDPTLGCSSLINGDELDGKIAMIDRGGCEFGLKALNAQDAGAIAVIVCNFEDAFVTMAGGAVGNQVTIPAVFMQAIDCQQIRTLAGEGLSVNLQLPSNSGPSQVDSDMDNGIIAHEYGHGISNRLTGGRFAAGCLGNGEQMGEGWSDFFSLITTVKSSDAGDTRRGIGNYAVSGDIQGTGIRRRPYSTDINVYDLTYADIVGQGVHGTGEVWAQALWDMYWLFVEVYGFDEDLINGTGGNNIAVQLVMDGMKLQPCSPGFVDGRDAILQADSINNDAANSCLIWEAFAKRGIGFSALQGSEDTNGDQTEAFDLNPLCIPELKIAKTVTPTIQAGEEVTVNLTATNHKGEPVTSVLVTDEIPDGLTYVAGSGMGGNQVLVDGNTISFDLGTMQHEEVIQMSYTLSSDPGLTSTTTYFDGFEDGDDDWEFDAFDGIDVFELTDAFPFEGDFSWYVPSTDNQNDQVLQNLDPILVTGTNPALRIIHQYETPAGTIGGLVQISTDGGNQWQDTRELMIRNGYPAAISYFTFVIPNLSAFSGNSNGYIPTYIDLSAYVGQEIKVRFRFGSDDGGSTGALLGLGWFVDNFEFMDLLSYNGEACIMSDEGDMACVIAEERGTIVDSDGVVSTEDVEIAQILSIYPNPAKDVLNIALTTESAENINLELLTVDGKTIKQQAFRTNGDYQLIPMAVNNLPGGFYFVRLSSGSNIVTKKVVIQ